jgi:hypothetical protein
VKPAPRARAAAPTLAPEWWLPLLAAAAAVIAFWNSLHYGFAQDAFTWLARTRGLIPHTTGWWRTLSYDGYYRVMDALFGLDPWPYRVVGLALHAINAVLFTLLGLRLGLSRAATFATAMFFAAHNAHFDTLFAIASISELLAAMFVLVALWLALPPEGSTAGTAREIGVVAAFAAALLSKETVVLFPALLWLMGRVRPGTARRAVIPCAILAVIYLVVFWITDPVGSLHAPRGANVYEPRVSWGLLGAWATYQAWCVHLFNFQASDLHDRIALHPEGWLVTAAGLVTLELLVSRSRRAHHLDPLLPAAAIGAATYTAFIVPVLPLLTHSFHLYLYLPLTGFGWMLAAAWDAWVPRKARWIACLLGVWMAWQGTLIVRAMEEAPMRGTQLPFMGSVRRAVTAGRVLKGLGDATAPLPDTLMMLGPDALSPPTRPDTTRLGAFLFNDVAGALNEGTGVRVAFPHVRQVRFFGDLGPWINGPDAVVFSYEGNLMRGPTAWLYLKRAQVEWDAGRVPNAAVAMNQANTLTRRWTAQASGSWRDEGLAGIRAQAQGMIDAEGSRAYPPGDPRAATRPGYVAALRRILEIAR